MGSKKRAAGDFLFTLSLICFVLLAFLGHQQQIQVFANPISTRSILYQTSASSGGRNGNNNVDNNINQQQQKQTQPKKFSDLDDFFSNLLDGENRLKKSKSIYRPAKQTLRFGKRSDPWLSNLHYVSLNNELPPSISVENYFEDQSKEFHWPE